MAQLIKKSKLMFQKDLVTFQTIGPHLRVQLSLVVWAIHFSCFNAGNIFHQAKSLMLIIIAVSVILLLPIISYLLHPLSNQKSIVFLATFFIFGGFIINFFSTNSSIGSWVYVNQSESIHRSISRNEELNSPLINQYLENTSSNDESFMRGVQVFIKPWNFSHLIPRRASFKP